MSPSQQLVTKSSSVSELIKSTYFVVPPNQREYRWGREQLEKLWEDLVTAVKEQGPGGNTIGHFLGAIVVIGQEQSHDNSRWEIIDGQQRLTTITILSECLRSYTSEIKDQKIRLKLEHVLLDCVVAPNSEFVPRLKLNREDDFYCNSLFENASIESKREYWERAGDKKSEVQSNIVRAFEFFYKAIDNELEGKDSEARQSRIRDLSETLTEYFYVLVVRTANLSLAYRLFETLNERGLDLSQADLIKNVLLEHAMSSGGSIVDNVTKLWDVFIDNFESQPDNKKLDLPQLIQFSFTYRHYRVKKEMIFEEVSKLLSSTKIRALDFAKEFNKDSLNWRQFLLSDLKDWDSELEDLRYAVVDPLWKSHCASFIMAVMDKHGGDIALLKEYLMLAENYLFRQGLIAKDSVGSLQEFFGEASSMVRADLPLGEVSSYFSRRSSDERFIENFSRASVSNVRQAFYIIWKIENHIKPVTEVRPINNSASQWVEFILPRKPGADWGGVQEKEGYAGYLNRIGNLLILPTDVNQKVKNKALSVKFESEDNLDYLRSGLSLPMSVAKNTHSWLERGEWTFESIARRQQYLAETYATDVWRLKLEV
ncbi:DUF262 domain-containing protein [Pseudomonas asplenii]|uniref:DUF262 domain-containing protein n=1 Tax=Pseudomonas asplenii TaxID=53407 RepID=UPI002234C3FC|nr:DUF262 domain-containing HNH endonuclease family protein [Pseudomonas asplenii]UZE31144.1 DUF262 domain-containing HNH endonuclease family protein [Pseudomonas asplenii]